MNEGERRAPIARPTEERTTDQTTQSASWLGGEGPRHKPEPRYDDDERGRTEAEESPAAGAPRRYDDRQDDAGDATMPSDDPSLGTKI